MLGSVSAQGAGPGGCPGQTHHLPRGQVQISPFPPRSWSLLSLLLAAWNLMAREVWLVS